MFLIVRKGDTNVIKMVFLIEGLAISCFRVDCCCYALHLSSLFFFNLIWKAKYSTLKHISAFILIEIGRSWRRYILFFFLVIYNLMFRYLYVSVLRYSYRCCYIYLLKFTHLVLRDKAFKVDPSAP